MYGLDSINNSIVAVTNKIATYNDLILKLSDLKANTLSASTKFSSTYNNLSKGLVIDGDSVDKGGLERLAKKLANDSSTIEGIIEAANAEITSLNNELTRLYAERARIKNSIDKNKNNRR